MEEREAALVRDTTAASLLKPGCPLNVNPMVYTRSNIRAIVYGIRPSLPGVHMKLSTVTSTYCTESNCPCRVIFFMCSVSMGAYIHVVS